jgi:hypothetical protein
MINGVVERRRWIVSWAEPLVTLYTPQAENADMLVYHVSGIPARRIIRFVKKRKVMRHSGPIKPFCKADVN